MMAMARRTSSSAIKRAICYTRSHVPTSKSNKQHSSLMLSRRLNSSQSNFQHHATSSTKRINTPTTQSTKKQKTRYILIGAGATLTLSALASAHYVQDHVGGTEGLIRTLSFYSLAIPRYFTYRFLMYKPNATDSEWDDLHTETSQLGLEKILELRGFYIKSGQMAAANIGNAFPKIWQDTMSVLQDECPPQNFGVVRRVIEDDFGGRKLEEIFRTFDEIPIGAASIGQVHRATLLNGDRVVVKIMYPEVESIFRGDVRTIKMFCKIAQPVHVPSLEEIEKQFMTEFNYKREAEQMDRIRNNLHSMNKLCSVPKPYLEFCTKRVLVMEELKGDKLAVGLRRNAEKHASKLGITPDQLQQQLKTLVESQEPLSEEQYNRYIALMNLKRKAKNISNTFYNYLLASWVPGFDWKEYEDTSALPINHAKIMDDLMYLHGYEVLVNGYFNGDPHPGNILLIEENNSTTPKLGLIDYGQVKEISKKDRLLFCKIVIALANDDKDEIVKLMKEAGYKSKNMDEENMYKYAKVSYDEDNHELTEGMHIQLFMEELQRRDPIEELPKQFLMISRTTILLRGLGHALNQSRSVAQAWRPIAEKVLEEEGEEDGSS